MCLSDKKKDYDDESHHHFDVRNCVISPNFEKDRNSRVMKCTRLYILIYSSKVSPCLSSKVG